MNSLFKKTSMLVAAFVVILSLIVLSIGKAPINAFIVEKIVSGTKKQQLFTIALEGADFGVFSSSATSLDIFLAPLFSLFTFENLLLTPDWPAILTGSFDFSLQTKFARGQSQFELKGMSANGADVSGKITNIDITALPHARLLGFSAGNADLRIEGIELKRSRSFPNSGVIAVSMTRIEKPKPSKIQLQISGNSLPFEIPPLKRGELECTVVFADAGQKMQIKKLDFLSSWGALSFSGVLGDRNTIRLAGTVHLSAEGHSAFRAYLPLISQGSLRYETRSFSLALNGDLSNPQRTFTDISQ